MALTTARNGYCHMTKSCDEGTGLSCSLSLVLPLNKASWNSDNCIRRKLPLRPYQNHEDGRWSIPKKEQVLDRHFILQQR